MTLRIARDSDRRVPSGKQASDSAKSELIEIHRRGTLGTVESSPACFSICDRLYESLCGRLNWEKEASQNRREKLLYAVLYANSESSFRK